MAGARYTVFINHRVADELDFVYRIRDRFVSKYGEERVFMAPDSIPASADSEKFLFDSLNSSLVLLAIVGPKWEALLREKIQSGTEDWVRKEIRIALERKIIVAPICIKRDMIPSEETVPKDIQPFLSSQFSFVRANSNFHRDVDVLISDIEDRLTSQGISPNSSLGIGGILHRNPNDIEEYLVRQIDEGNLTTIKKHLRDFPADLIDFAADLDSERTDSLISLGEKISAFGTTFLVHDQVELFNLFLQSLRQISTLAYRRLTTENQKRSAIWHEVLKNLYFLGALAIAEKKSPLLTSLMNCSIQLASLDITPCYWLKHLQRNRASELSQPHGLLFDVIHSTNTLGYLHSQFLNFEESLEECLCRCDFIHCLFLDLVADRNGATAMPYFGVFYLEYIAPIFEQIIVDLQFRENLFGIKVSNEDLALAFARYCVAIRRSRPAIRDFTHSPLWDNSMPTRIRSFLKENLDNNSQLHYDALYS